MSASLEETATPRPAQETISTDYDANKPLVEIEEDIAQTRADISETLDALERRLAPRHLLEKGMDMVRDSMDGNFERITEGVRANPIPLALIGAGIGWLLFTQSGGTQVVDDATRGFRRSLRSGLSDAGERAGGIAGDLVERAKGLAGMSSAHAGESQYAHARAKTEEMGDKVAGYGADMKWRAQGAMSQAGDAAGQATGRVAASGSAALQSIGEYADQAGTQLRHAGDRLAEVMEEHPIAVGALAFLAGAACAMLLPTTRGENRYLGETRDRLVDKARETGRDVLERAERVAGAAADAATDAVKRETSRESHPVGSS